MQQNITCFYALKYNIYTYFLNKMIKAKVSHTFICIYGYVCMYVYVRVFECLCYINITQACEL